MGYENVGAELWINKEAVRSATGWSDRTIRWKVQLACIIHVVEGAKSLLCYKHVVKTVFGATKEASA